MVQKEPHSPKNIKKEVASILNMAEIAMISADGTITYSEVSKVIEGLVKNEALRAFPHLSVGDYMIKHLDTSGLLIGKIADDSALAINAAAKMGLLILAFEKVIGALKSPDLEKSKPPVTPGMAAETPKAMSAEVREVKAKPSSPQMLTVSSQTSLNPWSVLELAPSSQSEGIELDANMIKLVHAANGVKSVEELAKETNISLQEALTKLNFLKEKEVLRLSYDEAIYQRIPKVTGGVDGVAPVAFGMSFGKMRNLRDLLKRMDGKKSVLALAVEFGVEPEKMRVLIENLERKKVIEF